MTSTFNAHGQSKPERIQVAGFLTQLAATTSVHIIGDTLIDLCHKPRYERTPHDVLVAVCIWLCKFDIAKRLQNYVSDNLFEFESDDWAAAENNYANFYGWLLACIKDSIV